MKSITQDIKYYQAILSYADQHGVTKAAIKYRTYRQFIYRLRNRYDGTPESLVPKSRRPHHHPNEHSDREIALIRRMRKRRPNTGLVRFWVRMHMLRASILSEQQRDDREHESYHTAFYPKGEAFGGLHCK